jgi:hypothetical protein
VQKAINFFKLIFHLLYVQFDAERAKMRFVNLEEQYGVMDAGAG